MEHKAGLLLKNLPDVWVQVDRATEQKPQQYKNAFFVDTRDGDLQDIEWRGGGTPA